MKVHFIGIGGIGVSALAQYYLQKGHAISGSDLAPSEITDFLEKKGVKIFTGNKAEHITRDINLVIHSPAVKKDNPEFMQAAAYGIKTMSYPEALGELTRQYTTIAVSGSHGKSTTTAMVALVLIKAGIDPTVIVGTKLKEFGGSNFRMGNSKYLVIEACEYDSSFDHYSPHIAVITNIDKEHLDYFKTFANVKKAFKQFAAKAPKDGFLVVNKDDGVELKIKSSASSAEKHKSKVSAKIKNYSLKQAESKKLRLQIPGKHNISNALAALTVARMLGVNDEIIFSTLAEYQGSWRRFEKKEANVGGKKITVISDYGHHPNEVLVTLQSTREKFSDKKIWCIFQPHQYQRTFYLMKDFIKVFRKAPIDQIIITDIYDVAGREEKTINQQINSKSLVEKIKRKHVMYLPLEQAEKFAKERIEDGEVLIIMGAGDIYKLVDKF